MMTVRDGHNETKKEDDCRQKQQLVRKRQSWGVSSRNDGDGAPSRKLHGQRSK